MALNLINLDRVRDLMVTEFDLDTQHDRHHISSRLSRSGVEAFKTSLRQAAQGHEDEWLAQQLRNGPHFNAQEQRKTRNGVIWANVPHTAADTLAEGEFNRLYMRGLCLLAIAERIDHLVVYRAKEVASPRPESEMKIGASVDPKRLLEDLRTHPGVDTALGLPNGPNSGLSARLP